MIMHLKRSVITLLRTNLSGGGMAMPDEVLVARAARVISSCATAYR